MGWGEGIQGIMKTFEVVAFSLVRKRGVGNCRPTATCYQEEGR